MQSTGSLMDDLTIYCQIFTGEFCQNTAGKKHYCTGCMKKVEKMDRLVLERLDVFLERNQEAFDLHYTNPNVSQRRPDPFFNCTTREEEHIDPAPLYNQGFRDGYQKALADHGIRPCKGKGYGPY